MKVVFPFKLWPELKLSEQEMAQRGIKTRVYDGVMEIVGGRKLFRGLCSSLTARIVRMALKRAITPASAREEIMQYYVLMSFTWLLILSLEDDQVKEDIFREEYRL